MFLGFGRHGSDPPSLEEVGGRVMLPGIIFPLANTVAVMMLVEFLPNYSPWTGPN